MILFSSMAVFFIVLTTECLVIVMSYLRRKEYLKLVTEIPYTDDFHFYASTFVYQMIKEGQLNASKSRFTHQEKSDAWKNVQLRTNAEDIKGEISNYFLLDNNFVEGPYFGYDADDKKNFRDEEHVLYRFLTPFINHIN